MKEALAEYGMVIVSVVVIVAMLGIGTTFSKDVEKGMKTVMTTVESELTVPE